MIQQYPNSKFAARLYASYKNEVECLRKALKIYTQLCMPRRMLTSLIDLAKCLLANSRRNDARNIRLPESEELLTKKEAMSVLRQASDICEQVYGADSVSAYWLDIAMLYEQLSDPLNAESIYQRLVKITALVNSQSVLHARCVMHLGTFYVKEKRYLEAETCLKQAAGILLHGKDLFSGCELIWPSLLKFYTTTKQTEKLRELFSACIDAFKSLPADKIAINFLSEIAKKMAEFADSPMQLKQLIEVWDCVEKFRPHSEFLLREVQRFCGVSGRISIAALPFFRTLMPVHDVLSMLKKQYENKRKFQDIDVIQVKQYSYRTICYEREDVLKGVRSSYQSC